jgi:hypothetical protein
MIDGTLSFKDKVRCTGESGGTQLDHNRQRYWGLSLDERL